MKVPCRAPKGWNVGRIQRILHNEIYAGITYFGKTRTKSKMGKKIILAKLPKDEWIKIPVPHLAVIDTKTYEAVQARKERNTRLQLRHTKRRYLMSGHFKCACSRKMSGYKESGRNNLRYRCYSYWKLPVNEPCPAAKHSIVCHKIDDVAWDWICNLLTDEQALEDGLKKMIENNQDETGSKRKRLDTLKNLVAKHEGSIERLVTELSEGV